MKKVLLAVLLAGLAAPSFAATDCKPGTRYHVQPGDCRIVSSTVPPKKLASTVPPKKHRPRIEQASTVPPKKVASTVPPKKYG